MKEKSKNSNKYLKLTQNIKTGFTIPEGYFNSIENVFQQYALGLLPDDVWSQVESRMMSHYSNCKLRHYYNSVIPALKKYVTTLPQDCSELITLDDWSASE